MGRRKKQADIEDAIGDAKANGIGHNGSPLSDDQKLALTLNHKKHYAGALATKRAADAALKLVCKKAADDLGDTAVADIKDLIAAETPEGEAKIRAEIERQHRVARWLMMPVGSQAAFDVDLTPAADRAYEDGKRAGMQGAPGSPPHHPSTPQYQRWLEGHGDGQEILASAFKLHDIEPVDASDPPFAAPPDADMPAAPAAPSA